MKRMFVLLSLIFTVPCYSHITEKVFRDTLKEFEALYIPRVQNDLHLKIDEIRGIWTPKSIIAFSSIRVLPEDQEARIQIDGEFAQMPDASKEAFALIVCHEFGHLYKDRPGISKLLKEGQADYFASQCALDYFKQSSSEAANMETLPAFMEDQCRLESQQYDSCIRVASGIASFAKVKNVDMTALYDSEAHDFVAHSSLHPAYSCRVKTFLAGLFKNTMPRCASVQKGS